MESSTKDNNLPYDRTQKVSIKRKVGYGFVVTISMMLFMIAITSFYLGLTVSGWAALQAPSYLMVGGMSSVAGGFFIYLIKRDYDKNAK
ncbi:MAG: hypothetical protein ACPKPY_06695 [Nitrososphaeraceae archaeon]